MIIWYVLKLLIWIYCMRKVCVLFCLKYLGKWVGVYLRRSFLSGVIDVVSLSVCNCKENIGSVKAGWEGVIERRIFCEVMRKEY